MSGFTVVCTFTGEINYIFVLVVIGTDADIKCYSCYQNKGYLPVGIFLYCGGIYTHFLLDLCNRK